MPRYDKYKPEYRISRDGPGWGVEEYHEIYDDWSFVNEEPFATKEEAIAYCQGLAPNRNWERYRKRWARGLYS